MLQIFQKTGFVLLLACLVSATQAQYRTFKFKAKKNNLYLTTKQDAGNSLAVLAQRIRANELAQMFIIKRVENQPGTALIVAAKDNQLFLRRQSNGTVSFTTYDAGNANNYKWSIDYAGFPFCLITEPNNGQRALMVQNDGSLLMYAHISGLDNNTNDAYRFRLEWVHNAF